MLPRYPLFSTLMKFLNIPKKSYTLLIPSLSIGATLSSMATLMENQQNKEKDTVQRSARYIVSRPHYTLMSIIITFVSISMS